MSLPSFPQIRHILSLWLVVVVGMVNVSWSEGASTSERVGIVKWIQAAREAYALGQLKQVSQSLKKAEKALQRAKGLPSHDNDNITLWLHLLWSKFHRVKALLPPIRKLRDFESRAGVRHHKDKIQQALRHLEKGLYHLSSYNRLFRQVTRKLRVKDALAIVNTNNQAGILKNRVSIVKLRLLRLQRIISGWKPGRKPGTKSSSRAQEKNALRGLKKIRTMQLTLKGMFRRQAKAIQRSENVYLHFLRDLKRRKRGSLVLTWVGVSGLIVGVGSGIAGGVLHGESEAWAVVDVRKKISPGDARLYKNWGTGLLVGGSILAVIGASTWLVGSFLSPGRSAKYQGVYRSHKGYLDWEGKSPTPSSSRIILLP